MAGRFGFDGFVVVDDSSLASRFLVSLGFFPSFILRARWINKNIQQKKKREEKQANLIEIFELSQDRGQIHVVGHFELQQGGAAFSLQRLCRLRTRQPPAAHTLREETSA
jgi:hypothetical protein